MSGFSAVVTTGIYCRPGLLRAPESRKRPPFRPCRGGRGRRVPGVPAMPSVSCGRSDRRRRLRGGVPWDPSRRRGRAADRQRGGRRGTTRGVGPPPPPPLSGAGGGHSGAAGALEPGALRAAAPRRHRPLRHRDRLRIGLRQPAPVQPHHHRRSSGPRPASSGPAGASPTASWPTAGSGCVSALPVRSTGSAMLGYLAARAITGRRARCRWVSTAGRSSSTVIPGSSRLPRVARTTSCSPRTCPHWGGLIHVVQQVRRLFNLDFDLDVGHAALGRRPRAQAAHRRHFPGFAFPAPGIPSRWASARSSASRSPSPAPGTIIGRVVARHGTPGPRAARSSASTHLFPAAETLAEADLAGTGLTGARMAAIHGFARRVAGRVGPARPEPVARRAGGHGGAVPGLGPWTAQYLALRLGESDAFPTVISVCGDRSRHSPGTL